jgi:hypothetical protein
MSLYFKPAPFTDKDGNLIQLQDLEIIEFGALNDEVTVQFTFKGKWMEQGQEGIEGRDIEDLQPDLEREWNMGSEFLKTKIKKL